MVENRHKAWIRTAEATAFHARWYMRTAQEILSIDEGEEEDLGEMARAQGYSLLAIASWLDLIATGGDESRPE